MRRFVALIAAVALLASFTGLAFAGDGGYGGTAAGPRAYGRFLMAEYGGGPIGWVTFDVRLAANSPSNTTPDSLFRFDALPGVASPGVWPVTTRSVVASLGSYHEDVDPRHPDVVFINGFECFYFPLGAETGCRPFTASFFDVGPLGRNDFFRWGETPIHPPAGWEPPEYRVAAGNITVVLGH
jgi:hypothetical protein